MSDFQSIHRNKLYRNISSLLLAFGSGASGHAAVCLVPHDDHSGKRTWGFECGVAFITSNSVDDLINGQLDFDDRPAGGEIYQFSGVRRLGELVWEVGECVFHPQLELPITLEIVDENGRAPFPDLNASFTVRWVDFPWNDYLPTTFSMGIGLSYSTKLYLEDIKRHPGEERSKLKFNWPIQLTFAAPHFPDLQFMLYLSHQSGGLIFDQGGVNSLGCGLRRDF